MHNGYSFACDKGKNSALNLVNPLWLVSGLVPGPAHTCDTDCVSAALSSCGVRFPYWNRGLVCSA